MSPRTHESKAQDPNCDGLIPAIPLSCQHQQTAVAQI